MSSYDACLEREFVAAPMRHDPESSMISTTTLLVLLGTTASLDLIAATDTMSVMQISGLITGERGTCCS